MFTPTATATRYCGCIDPSLEALVTVRDALTDALRAAGWSEEDAFRVLVCADEAMANALTHGHTNDAPIDIRFRVGRRAARVAVRDRRPATTLPTAVSTPDEAAEHGRGLILMRALADRFRIHPSPTGTCVGLAFRPAAVT